MIVAVVEHINKIPKDDNNWYYNCSLNSRKNYVNQQLLTFKKEEITKAIKEFLNWYHK